jgi:hypothetical protein
MRLYPLGALFAIPILILAGCHLQAEDEKSESESQTRPTEVTAKLEEALDRKKQQRTVADLRNVGTAMFSWVTDHVSAGAAGQAQVVELADYPAISRQELERILVPQYLQSLPETDGWGHPYDFRLKIDDLRSLQIMFLRSPGRDGVYSDAAGAYTAGSFPPEDYDQDLVWADGAFIRWPERGASGGREGAP